MTDPTTHYWHTTPEAPLRRKHARSAKAALAIGLAVGMLTLSACGGGSGAEGGNAMAGLETAAAAGNENLAIGDNMAVPADWPAAVPVFSSGSLTTVAVNPGGSAAGSWITPATAEAVGAEYDAALLAAGYKNVEGTELTGVEDMSGGDYSGNGYLINVIVSTTDGETTIFVTAAPS